jgi:hypothetical protein
MDLSLCRSKAGASVFSKMLNALYHNMHYVTVFQSKVYAILVSLVYYISEGIHMQYRFAMTVCRVFHSCAIVQGFPSGASYV